MSNNEENRRALTFGDKLKIVQWLGCIQERLKSEMPTYVEVCKWVHKELNITIRPRPLRSICDDASITWERRQNDLSSGTKNIWNAIKQIQDEVLKLMTHQESVRAQLAEIRGTIVSMCREAGLKTTPAFAARNEASQTSLVNRQ